ncbi:hypothetical protein DPMN_026555 [Dreissena polymorpha]|uniref:Uncharacterized protein n=1 Tax=Dreissena polymorpha TaxID=45954 RepID=A0A9D4RCQ0_DREPO|nr:hypothetical protein DPMN_026555 [Dreissena polymorpha]
MTIELKNMTSYVLTRKNTPTNLLTKFHEDWTINKTCHIPSQQFFHPAVNTFELAQDIFYEDLTFNVASRLTMKTLCSAPTKIAHGRTDTRTDRRSGDYLLPQNILGEHTKSTVYIC